MQPFSFSTTVLQHLKWQTRLFNVLYFHHKKIVVSAILLKVFSQFSHIISVFLPIKIILILGDQGIQYNMERVLGSEYTGWVMWLVLATIVLYVIAIVADITEKKITKRTSILISKLDADAPKKLQKTVAKALATACKGYASIVVILAGLFIVIVLDQFLFSFILFVIFLEIIVINIIMNGQKEMLKRVSVLLETLPLDYIKYLGAANFIFVFMALLMAYFQSGEFDVIKSILVLLISRRVFESFSDFLRVSLQLEKVHVLAGKNFLEKF